MVWEANHVEKDVFPIMHTFDAPNTKNAWKYRFGMNCILCTQSRGLHHTVNINMYSRQRRLWNDLWILPLNSDVASCHIWTLSSARENRTLRQQPHVRMITAAEGVLRVAVGQRFGTCRNLAVVLLGSLEYCAWEVVVILLKCKIKLVGLIATKISYSGKLFGWCWRCWTTKCQKKCLDITEGVTGYLRNIHR